MSFLAGDSAAAEFSSTGCDRLAGVWRAGDLGARDEGTVILKAVAFGLAAGDRGAKAAEKLGGFGRCVDLIGLDSAGLVGLDDAARGVGAKDVAFALNMEGPDGVGTGIELGFEADASGKACSLMGSFTLGVARLRDFLGNDVVSS